ncbi:hypothetical protein FNV43_RR16707 [Rhamnella rubrinervis]|uniref:GTD-binding domain-containing protein n=1 Tax=Rhamnella rubrinervis TaxID=2594499 RepID=A0A8K0MDF7_9ROSA|nr:hypothetical protein FNV43_RR16707 [Rhamnella rubrinervis]
MDLEALPSSRDLVRCCNCGCSCSLISSSSFPWLRSVKRKYDEFEDGNRFFIPGFDFSVARVQIENECAALRETVSSQQLTIQDLYVELEEERNASSSAANEAMSMILRLQREKAEIQMEARQFKRFSEEKTAHDQEELFALEDLLYKREQTIQSLTCEVQAYKHRLMSYGLTEAEAEGEKGRQSMVEFEAQYELPLYDYPPLKCNVNETHGHFEGDDDATDIEKYAFGETPKDRLRNLENRIYQMERSPSNNQLDGDFSGSKHILEKVIVGHSPKPSRHSRRFSNDFSPHMGMVRETGPNPSTESPWANTSFKKTEYVTHSVDDNTRKLDNVSEAGDDMSDRVYTIDSIHNDASYNGFTEPKAGVGIGEDYIATPRGSMNHGDVADPDVKKLYMRLQALEADRESMRQALVSMRTDKAQLVLLKEIAQHLCKEMSPERQMTVPVKKPSLLGSFSFMSVFKWVTSFVFWRNKARRSKNQLCSLLSKCTDGSGHVDFGSDYYYYYYYYYYVVYV